MEIEVSMLRFMDGEIRTVVIPDDEWRDACETDAANRSGLPDAALEKIYHYGQNDFQPVHARASVSVGDVATVDGKCFRVDSVGFSAMNAADMEQYLETPRRDREFWKHNVETTEEN